MEIDGCLERFRFFLYNAVKFLSFFGVISLVSLHRCKVTVASSKPPLASQLGSDISFTLM